MKPTPGIDINSQLRNRHLTEPSVGMDILNLDSSGIK